MARALVLESRSPSSSSLARGRPNRTPRIDANVRPTGVVGTLAASLAVSIPLPV